MLSFSQFALLLENRIEYLKQNSGVHPDIIDKLAEIDPSENKQYTQWLVKQHKLGHVLPQHENHKEFIIPNSDNSITTYSEKGSKRLHNLVLKHFQHPNVQRQMSEKGLSRDLNSYKNIHELHSKISNIDENAPSEKEMKRRAMEGSEKIHEEPGLKVYKVTTPEAAKIHGKGTKWCTASTNPDYAHHAVNYLKAGPLYVFHQFEDAENKKPSGRKVQLHISDSRRYEFKNELNDNGDLDHFVFNHPSLIEHPEFKGKHDAFLEPKERIEKLLGNNRYREAVYKYRAHLMPEFSNRIWRKAKVDEHVAGEIIGDTAINKHNMDKKEHLKLTNKIIDEFHDHPSSDIRNQLSHNTSQRGLEKLASAKPVGKGKDRFLDEVHEDILNRGNKKVHLAAAQSPDKMLRTKTVLSSPHQHEVHEAFMNSHYNDHESHTYSLDPHAGHSVSSMLAGRQEHAEEHIARAGHKPHLDKLIHHDNPWVRAEVMKHGHDDHLRVGMNDDNEQVRAVVASHPKFAHLMLNDKSQFVRDKAKANMR